MAGFFRTLLDVFLGLLPLAPLLLALCVPAAWVVVSHLRDRRRRLAQLARALGPDARLRARDRVVEGQRAGRRVRVAVARDVTYAVEVPARTTELLLEDARAARDWLGGAGAHGREALAAVDHLAACGVRRLEAADGWLTAHRPFSEQATREASALAILDALARLAPLLGRAPLQVTVAGVHGAVAWAEDERLLCPYCRDDLAAERLEVVCCPACRTAHHAECFADAGGCTVLGCRGAPAPWTRVRGG